MMTFEQYQHNRFAGMYLGKQFKHVNILKDTPVKYADGTGPMNGLKADLIIIDDPLCPGRDNG